MGRRSPAAHPVEPHRDLRVPREGTDRAPSRRARRACAARISASRRIRSIQHLQSLGVTAVELLPIHQADRRPLSRSRAGSRTTGATTRSPSSRPTSATRRPAAAHRSAEFKTMVKRLHRAGIEVILDVVYNHTGEGDQRGPTLSLRGIDNAVYYRLDPADPRTYVDFTGCGNTLEPAPPARHAARARQPALLGRGDARRRLPLRPGARARARRRRSTRAATRSSRWCARTRCSRA